MRIARLLVRDLRTSPRAAARLRRDLVRKFDESRCSVPTKIASTTSRSSIRSGACTMTDDSSSADHTSCIAFLVVFPQPQLVLHAIAELRFAEFPVVI